MKALSELFDETRVLVPCSAPANRRGEIPLTGDKLSITPLTTPAGSGLWRKVGMLWWLMRNLPSLIGAAWKADVIHTPIPGDVGTIGMLLALLFRKPLFVRHCGNWEFQRTIAEKFWRRLMERFAGGSNVMLATGGADSPPSKANPAIRWIFSTSLTEAQLNSCRIERRELNAGSVKLIVVSRLERFKGVDVLLESLPSLLAEYPGLTQEIVGDGASANELKAQAKRLGLNGHVNFHGRLDHEGVIEQLKRADLFCYPTKSDGFPKAVLEALACGLPVIATPVSVIPQLLRSGCGILIDEANPQQLAQAIRRCLSDPDCYQEMSERAIATARQYSLERWRDELGEMLRQAGVNLRS